MAVQRWTDEMLDELASTVSDVKDGIDGLRDRVDGLTDSVDGLRDSVDGLRVTTQALLQLAAQSQQDMELMKQRQEENDQRFNILLEEVRYLIRGNQDN
ncbi:hypothetical protein PCC8801_2528 [Rippkaea orientalis PCC 8801]|uniref:Uncharacterized protein n=1 Tax=Rippkaea orientalis (strain PCC 8801 / RF-1) TaxID=41431 RepID=B7K3Z6_RIPO1|nr:hypothetical protein [Rippkaea orientalis]ACK66536.1 hypothetical protein PCC8801_2528 [Rippkaea orientalis PCC 8801]